LEVVYGQGAQTLDDVIQPMDGAPIAASVLDKYIQALGGAAKLATIKSYSATGTSAGFGGFGGGGQVQIFAKAPDSRTTWIQFKKETERPDAIPVTNGRTAWVKAPLTVLGEYELTGGELDGAKLDAQMSLPRTGQADSYANAGWSTDGDKRSARTGQPDEGCRRFRHRTRLRRT
jgi:hypothetical protein